MCENCRMTISDFHYSAEIIEKGKAHKFDDIGCMLAYAQANNLSPQKTRFWVMDFDSTTWIKGEEAHFVISSEIHTPMGYGIIAFKDPIKAKETADKTGGKAMRLESLLKMDWKERHEYRY